MLQAKKPRKRVGGYYPFGMSMDGAWMNDLTANDKPYQYNYDWNGQDLLKTSLESSDTKSLDNEGTANYGLQLDFIFWRTGVV